VRKLGNSVFRYYEALYHMSFILLNMHFLLDACE
jgi:hypothetical protein